MAKVAQTLSLIMFADAQGALRCSWWILDGFLSSSGVPWKLWEVIGELCGRIWEVSRGLQNAKHMMNCDISVCQLETWRYIININIDIDIDMSTKCYT